MNDQTIKCDKCGNIIRIDEALSASLKEKFEGDFNVKLEEEKRKLWVIAQQKAEEKKSLELKDMQETIKENEKFLKEAREGQLKLMKEKRELEERQKQLDIENEKKLEEERKKIIEMERLRSDEENRLKMLEKDKQMEQMRKQIEDLRRKSEQGSMQIQGDVQENDLKRVLLENFPVDNLSDVATGIRGADLVQTVRNTLGNPCGIILWESKNTKAWDDKWLKKLKEDQSNSNADLCVIVSKILPEGVKGFKNIEGVWVSDFASVPALTFALRSQLIEVSAAKSSLVGRDEKMEVLYSYLGSSQFKNRIENIVLAFKSLKDDLEKEKRAFTKIWARRDKEIERVMNGTIGMYGDLQGIIGSSLPEIKELNLLSEGEDLEDTDDV